MEVAAQMFCHDECVFSVHRAAFSWFSVEPGWYEMKVQGMAEEEAQAVATVAQFLAQDCSVSVCNGEGSSSRRSRRPSRNASQPEPSTTQPQVTSCS